MEAREQFQAEAVQFAGMLHVVHDCVASWLAAQADDAPARDLVTHMETTGALPDATDSCSPLTAGERER